MSKAIDSLKTTPNPVVENPNERRGIKIIDVLIRSLLPVLLALIAGGIILWMLGKNPFQFYGDIAHYGLSGNNWQNSLIAMAPLLLIALGLIIAFRAQLWNLGYDGQYLLAFAIVAGLGPVLVTTLPLELALLILIIVAFIVAAVWSLIPAFLKAKYGTNEIITTLMMSFIGTGLANILVKGPFQDKSVVVPQTEVLPVWSMLPYVPGTRVHVGIIIALVIAVALYFVLTRSSFGLRLDVFGASQKAAKHVGIRSTRMVFTVFVLSAGLIGLAAAVDMLGLWGYLRTNWNPGYGNEIIPFVFLARLNPLAVIPLVAFYAVLSTGGTIAAQGSGLSVDFLLVIVALILVFMTIIEYVGTKRELGQSYLPQGLRNALRFGRNEANLERTAK